MYSKIFIDMHLCTYINNSCISLLGLLLSIFRLVSYIYDSQHKN